MVDRQRRGLRDPGGRPWANRNSEVRLRIQRSIISSLLLFFAIIASACAKSSEPIRIGVLVPLTGGAASYGENARKGAELALKEFSAKHSDLHVELSVEDSRGEAAVGTRAATKLIDLDHVVAIVGCVT